jgi:hypothetical protein
MYERKKSIFKKPIVFDYRSLNPFALVRKDEDSILHIAKEKSKTEENEWRIEYEMIYRSHQLDR